MGATIPNPTHPAKRSDEKRQPPQQAKTQKTAPNLLRGAGAAGGASVTAGIRGGDVRTSIPLRPVDRLVQELEAALGADSVASAAAHLAAYECDGLALFKERPRVVVLPRSTEETSAAAAILHRHRVPIV